MHVYPIFSNYNNIIKRAPASKFENPPPKPYCYWGDGLATDVL